MIRSGAQTGADRGALYGALDSEAVGLAGWVPRGFVAEDGTVPKDLWPYLKECSSSEYTLRTELNLRDSDATLVIHQGRMGIGTQGTIKRAIQRKAPVFVLNLRLNVATIPVLGWASFAGSDLKPGAVLDDFIARAKADVLARDAGAGPFDLNVAGPRESHAPGLQEAVRAFISGWLRP